MRLLSQTELFNDSAVALDVSLLEIAEKVSSVSDHLLETSAAVVVLVVSLEVLGEVLDAAGKKRDLHLGRTGVALVGLVSVDNCLLFVLDHDVFHLSKKYSATNTVPVGEIRFGAQKSAASGVIRTPSSRRYAYYNILFCFCKHFLEFYFIIF